MRILIITLSIITILLSGTDSFASRWDLVLLTTSGLNGQLMPDKDKNNKSNADMVRTFGGFARIQSVFKSYREKFPNKIITVATGDDLMGESLTNEQGKTVFGTMNMMGFDVSTLGNHEFDRGSKFLVKCLEIKEFPTVVSNLEITPSSRLRKFIKKDLIIKRNFLRVGFLGMILPQLNMISNPGAGISVTPDLIEVARDRAVKLKHSGKVDIVVLLSHLSIEDQRKILESVPEIDIICGGQSHIDTLPGQEVIARDSQTAGLMVQCGSHGRFVGVLKLKIVQGMIDKHEWTMIPIADQTEADKRIEAYINSHAVKSESSKPLATTAIILDSRASFIRTREAPIGKLVSSIMRDKFKTDIAFQNSGGIRGDRVIAKGAISAKDIMTMFPFGNTITILKVKGSTIKQILERSVHKLPEPLGTFLQTTGLRYVLDLNGTAQELEINSIGKAIRIKKPGNRISKIEIMGKDGCFYPLKPEQKYSITTNSFLANGGDGYLMLGKVAGKVETFIKVRDVIKFGLMDMANVKINLEPSILQKNGQPFFKN